MTRLLVVEHSALDPAGPLAGWLAGGGAEVTVHRVHEHGPPPATLPEPYAGLVVLGGGMGIGDTARHPWLETERALLRDAVSRAAPVLAVCLGAQQLAAALGGRVARARVGPEVGAGHVYATAAAAADPLFAEVPPVADVVQWHWDEIVELPPGAIHLAASPACPHQAFRVGPAAWGIQFHVEATPEVARAWAADDAAELAAAGLDPATVTASVAARWPDVESVWATVVRRFAVLSAGPARGRVETRENIRQE